MTKTKKTSVKKTQKCKFRLQKFTKQCKKPQKHKNVRSEASIKTSQKCKFRCDKKSQTSVETSRTCKFR